MSDVLRYLGVKDGGNEELNALISEMTVLSDEITPRVKYAYFSTTAVENGYFLDGTNIVFSGNLAKKQFNGCKGIVVILATLSLKSELMLKRIFAQNAHKAIVLDAVFTDKLESFLDDTERKLTAEYGAHTDRISCGYGDLNISLQKDLFAVLDGASLGVGINDCFMLYPNKSVIALVGVK